MKKMLPWLLCAVLCVNLALTLSWVMISAASPVDSDGNPMNIGPIVDIAILPDKQYATQYKSWSCQTEEGRSVNYMITTDIIDTSRFNELKLTTFEGRNSVMFPFKLSFIDETGEIYRRPPDDRQHHNHHNP